MLGLKHAPHRTALYRTRKRLSEEYMRRLNRKILERLKPAKKVGVDATVYASPDETAPGLQPAKAVGGNT